MSDESRGPVAPTVLLLGDPSSRPPGLEPALTRAGFRLMTREEPAKKPEADVALIGQKHFDEAELSSLLAILPSQPAVVLLVEADPDALAKAFALGAADVLAAPVHLPELSARLHARVRERAFLTPEEPSALAALDHRVRQEFERARRYSLSFSLVLMGIDELRSVEEQEGQETADRLRREVVTALRRELRSPDFVVGYRNSEFAIILPETGQSGARQSVLRVRERLAMVPGAGDPRLDHPRFSAGIVTYPHPAVSHSDELLPLAEAALVRGKTQAGERIGMAI